MPLLCLALLAAGSAESEPDHEAVQLDSLVDILIQDLKPLEDEYDAVSRAGEDSKGNMNVQT